MPGTILWFDKKIHPEMWMITKFEHLRAPSSIVTIHSMSPLFFALSSNLTHQIPVRKWISRIFTTPKSHTNNCRRAEKQMIFPLTKGNSTIRWLIEDSHSNKRKTHRMNVFHFISNGRSPRWRFDSSTSFHELKQCVRWKALIIYASRWWVVFVCSEPIRLTLGRTGEWYAESDEWRNTMPMRGLAAKRGFDSVLRLFVNTF